MKNLILVFLSLFFVAGCSRSIGEKDTDRRAANPKRLDWGAIPREFNPAIRDFQFRTEGIEKIDMNVFGFRDDVEVVYSADIQPNTGALFVYSVYKQSASWGDLRIRPNGQTLDIKNFGSYECSIKIENGRISSLQGGCYVRLQLFLPVSSQIEVYNTELLLTPRFHPISTEDFLKNFERATWAADKFAAIETYLESYDKLSRKPVMLAGQLQKVFKGFMRSEDKFHVLRRLHHAVVDRNNLSAVIESEFTYFDREEARRIAGL